MLRTVGVAPPENEQERLLARGEGRQHDLRSGSREIILLRDIGSVSAETISVFAAIGCRDRQPPRVHALSHLIGQRHSFRLTSAGVDIAGGVINDDGLRTSRNMVE